MGPLFDPSRLWSCRDQVDNFGLADVDAGLVLKHLAHLHAIEGLVALRARAPDCRAARGVEQAELDADSVGDLAMTPPRASTSRTRWPLATPPMAGL